MALLKRISRGLIWCVVWQDKMVILRAGPPHDDLATPAGFEFSQLAVTGGLDPIVAETAMLAAGEEAGLVTKRLEHGDHFFGWLSDGRVASFGWVTHCDRTIGPAKLRTAEGRVFLYNFHTLPEHRGRGLYPALLLHMRRALTGEGQTEFIIDVNSRNTASARGLAKAGFEPVAQITYVTVFRRWQWQITKALWDQSPRPLL